MDRLYGAGVAAGSAEKIRGSWLAETGLGCDVFRYFPLVWWKGVFVGDFANLGAQNVVYCVVIVVQLWCIVWLEVEANVRGKMGQVFGIYF
jgi:hypothetical protein